MSVEDTLFATLKGLVSNRVYRDVAPQTQTTLPWITFQQVGGAAINFIDPTVPSKKNARFQINVWAADRDSAAALARQVEDTLRVATALSPTVMGAPTALYDEDTLYCGYSQHFSVWFDS